MRIKQLFNLVLFTSLITTGYMGSEAVASAAENNAAGKAAMHHSGIFSGELIETFNSGGYTYVHLNTDKGPVWAAGPITTIKKGDKVSFTGKVAMIDFYSKSLDRTFDNIYFVGEYYVNGIKAATMTVDPHKNVKGKQPGALKSFTKAANGQDIAGILKNKDSLAGKTVKIRGQVSKYTAKVMGKNWIHVRDSSSDQDITIITDATAKMDDIIVAEGKLVLNKDYGYGYVYDVLIENAKVSVEPEK